MCCTEDTPHTLPPAALHGAERWFYGGEPPPELPHPGDPGPPAPDRTPPPDRVREPDQGREPPVREPRPHQSWSELSSMRRKAATPA